MWRYTNLDIQHWNARKKYTMKIEIRGYLENK